MKKSILFILTVIVSNTYAQQNSVVSNKFSVIEFLSPPSADSLRNDKQHDASVLDHLNFEVINVELQKFEEELKGEWRILYHCNGRPVSDEYQQYGHWYYREFDGQSVKSIAGQKKNPSQRQITKYGEYKVKPSSEDGIFSVTLIEHHKDLRIPFESKYSLIKIKETGETAISVNDINCPQQLFVRPVSMF